MIASSARIAAACKSGRESTLRTRTTSRSTWSTASMPGWSAKASASPSATASAYDDTVSSRPTTVLYPSSLSLNSNSATLTIQIPQGKAGFGSTVHLRAENGDTVVYQLVMPEDSDVDKGMISTSSPIGRAILNKEEGDDIKVVTPNGTRKFELLKLITIHDSAG